MSTPVLHVLAGPNGSGKTTFVTRVLEPVTYLPFINADVIATDLWPGDELAHAYDASQRASQERDRLFVARRSFITETVFSHPSKVELLEQAVALGYLTRLHVILVPEAVTVARVEHRVRQGGHDVPEEKIRQRFARLWDLVARAAVQVDRARFYDNGSASSPFREVATIESGTLIGRPSWPAWTPAPLLMLSS